MKLSISRYNPEHDGKPYLQDYENALDLGDHMLLDVILRLKQQDNTLTFRKSCREGVCGSDAMNINGRNGLACITQVRGLNETVLLRPLLQPVPVVRVESLKICRSSRVAAGLPLHRRQPRPGNAAAP